MQRISTDVDDSSPVNGRFVDVVLDATQFIRFIKAGNE
jgi:hypothetical protein